MQQDAGHIVNTASIAGLVAGPFMGPYNASKHAVVALSETLLHELAMSAPHVKVSVLCPGWVNTRIGESARNRPATRPRTAADLGAGLSLLQGVLDHGAWPPRPSPTRCSTADPGRAVLDPHPRRRGRQLGRRR